MTDDLTSHETGWREHDRVIGEFLRVYTDIEHDNIINKLKEQGGAATLLLKRKKRHQIIRNLISHGGHIETTVGSSDKKSWTTGVVSISMLAQMFLGIQPVTVEIRRREHGGNVATISVIKRSIAEMRLGIFITKATKVERLNRQISDKLKGQISDKQRLAPIHLPKGDIRGSHIKVMEEDTGRIFAAQYNENDPSIKAWEELDRAVGRFLRNWSYILCLLRELELIKTNPAGRSTKIIIESVHSDMKRAELVLTGMPIVKEVLRSMSKEKSLCIRGKRWLGVENDPETDRTEMGIVDEKTVGPSGKIAVISPSSIETIINETIKPVVNLLQKEVDERVKGWGH